MRLRWFLRQCGGKSLKMCSQIDESLSRDGSVLCPIVNPNHSSFTSPCNDVVTDGIKALVVLTF